MFKITVASWLDTDGNEVTPAGRRLVDYANAAGVGLEYASREDAEAAVRALQSKPDRDGVWPGYLVVEVE